MAVWRGGFDEGFTKEEFFHYVQNIRWSWKPKFITVHNTSAPTQAQWKATRGGEAQRMRNLEDYYKNRQGWPSGPHLFIGEKIWKGTPLNVKGTHTPSWNNISLGMEIAGDYDSDPFIDPYRGNAIHALAVLHYVLRLDPADYQLGVKGLHFHKEDPRTSHKRCPGKNISKRDLIDSVKVAMKQWG